MLTSETVDRGKNKDVPFALQEQWENDRKKKAENKAKRALERLKLAADPMVRKKGGKKGMKDSLAAARYAQELPNQVNSLISLEQQIRRFLADLGGPQSMALPPADKNTRKRVHELAGAFNLKSQSKGKGSGRYTTLIKTTRSGIQINEGKVRRILREVDPSWQGPDRRGRGQVSSLAKHKEGEEVGKVWISIRHLLKHAPYFNPLRLHPRLGNRISVSRCLLLWAGLRETGSDCLGG